mmetsp:Transcript_107600/g.169859  ORF Transcript_107600/g.169859 Transcript_107600/m.169859 type:complete len:284 (-) Transcript_107600:24-875(-)
MTLQTKMAESGGQGIGKAAFTRASRQGKKHRHAYNSYVAHQRQEKFYDRKKVKNKFKRTLRYEARMNGGEETYDKSSLLAQTLERGASAIEDEYERRLALSYGSPSESIAPKSHIATKKKRRRESTQQDTLTESVEADSPYAQKKKRRKSTQIIGDQKAQESSSNREGRTEELSKARKLQKEELPKGSSHKQQKLRKDAGAKRPDRFSKDLQKFHEMREAQEKEKQRRYEQEMARKRQRKQSAKGRAMKGNIISQRNARGQPKMQGILEGIVAKLAQEKQSVR